MRKVACLASKLAVALAATWCWAADLNAPAICIYDREQCFGSCSYAAASAVRRECIGVIETFRCELIGCNISCSRCHEKAPGSLTMPGACCESLPT
jgi:hypothetical protein